MHQLHHVPSSFTASQLRRVFMASKLPQFLITTLGSLPSFSIRCPRAPSLFAVLALFLLAKKFPFALGFLPQDFCKGSCVEIGNITYRRRTILLYIWKIRGGLTPWKGLYEQIGMTDWLIFRFLVLLSLKSFFLFLPCPCTGV
ncbi:uncharacterized protein LOC130721365 isoform X2 [Lotus japonicus]|uniref:uncharacterized protein LOC130721365 isoform X2 n=1 Tax=Lotus japonicus TaxID=34305 RepID=UPI00258D02A6|nr:uncharacterized protein LOC130721365 isoform X2 [Lotus japonicus]